MKNKIFIISLSFCILLCTNFQCNKQTNSNEQTSTTSSRGVIDLIFPSTVLFTVPDGYLTGMANDDEYLYLGWREEYSTTSHSKIYAIDRETGAYSVIFEEFPSSIFGITCDKSYVYFFSISNVSDYKIRKLNKDTLNVSLIADLNGEYKGYIAHKLKIFEQYIYCGAKYNSEQDRIVRTKLDGTGTVEDFLIFDSLIGTIHYLNNDGYLGIATKGFSINSEETTNCWENYGTFYHYVFYKDQNIEKTLVGNCSLNGVPFETYGDKVFYKDMDENVYYVTVDGKKKQLTFDNKDSDFLFSLFTDETYVYFFRNTDEDDQLPYKGELFMVAHEGGQPIRISEEIEFLDLTELPSGIVDDKYIFLCYKPKFGQYKIVRYTKREP